MKTFRLLFICCLLHFAGSSMAQTFTSYGVNEGLNIPYIRSIAVDRNGNKWLSTYLYGVYKFDGTTFTYITREDGLPSDTILSIAADDDGNVWFGTWNKGIARYDGQHWAYFDSTNGFLDGATNQIVIDKNYNVWTANGGLGVTKYDGTSFTRYLYPTIPDWAISGIYTDEFNNVWVSHHLGISGYDGSNWYTITEAQGLGSNYTYGINGDGNGTIWIITNEGVSKLSNAVFRNYDNFDGVPQNLTSLLVDHSGRPWVTSYGAGIAVLNRNTNTFKRYTSDDGLPHNQVMCSTNDNEGNIWVGTNGGGICKISGVTTGLNDVCSAPVVSVFPNPATDMITIDHSFLSASYSITDINGRVVSSGYISNNKIDVHALDKGVYFIRITDADQVFVAKCIKQ